MVKSNLSKLQIQSTTYTNLSFFVTSWASILCDWFIIFTLDKACDASQFVHIPLLSIHQIPILGETFLQQYLFGLMCIVHVVCLCVFIKKFYKMVKEDQIDKVYQLYDLWEFCLVFLCFPVWSLMRLSLFIACLSLKMKSGARITIKRLF